MSDNPFVNPSDEEARAIGSVEVDKETIAISVTLPAFVWQAMLEELNQDADWSPEEARTINATMRAIADALDAHHVPRDGIVEFPEDGDEDDV